MASILGQMFFNAQIGSRSFGWSEGHYNVTAANLDAALVDLEALAAARAKLCGAGVTMPYLRVSDINVTGDSEVDKGPDPQGVLTVQANSQALIIQAKKPGTQSITGLPVLNPEIYKGADKLTVADALCDQPEVGVLVRGQAGSTHTARRSIILRGVPDGITRSDFDRPDSNGNDLMAKWIAAYFEYLNLLKGGKWGFRHLDKSDTNKSHDVGGYAIDGITNLITMTCQGLGAQPGDYVRVSGLVTNDSKTNRNYTFSRVLRVAAVEGNDLTFTGFANLAKDPLEGWKLAFKTLKLGSMRKQIYVFEPYNKFVERRWARKKPGRPFDLEHGRLRRR